MASSAVADGQGDRQRWRGLERRRRIARDDIQRPGATNGADTPAATRARHRRYGSHAAQAYVRPRSPRGDPMSSDEYVELLETAKAALADVIRETEPGSG